MLSLTNGCFVADISRSISKQLCRNYDNLTLTDPRNARSQLKLPLVLVSSFGESLSSLYVDIFLSLFSLVREFLENSGHVLATVVKSKDNIANQDGNF